MAKKKGAQPGNKNAYKHGFYSEALDQAEQLELAEAADIDGLDNEIAVLRLKLRQLLQDHPDEIDLQIRLAGALARLIRTKYQITPEEKKHLTDAISKVLHDVAIPLGLKFIPGAG